MSSTFFSPTMWNVFDQKNAVIQAMNPSDHNILITLFFIVVFAFSWHHLYWRQRRAAKRLPPLPPGPRGVPLLGYLPFLGRDLHRQFAELAGLYGPIFKFWLGGKLCVVLTSPALVRELTRDKDTLFANHELSIAGAISTQGGKDIAFTPFGPAWKKLRRLFVQEAMNSAVLDGLRCLRREAVRKSVAHVCQRAGEEVDVGHLAFVTAVNSVLKMLWGGSMEGEEAAAAAADAEEFREAGWVYVFLVGKPNVSDLFPALAWLDAQGIARETRRLTAVFERMFDSAIEQRRKMLARGREDGAARGCEMMRKDFLQFLLEFQDDEKGEDSETSITMAQLKATLMDPVVGGTESSSVTVEWAMAELLRNPNAMRRAQEELAQVVGLNNSVEESHLLQLTYLSAVIKETLRLHPPFPLLVPRFPSETTTLGGYKVPKSTTIFINAWAIHRNPDVWEEHLKFKPERFLDVAGKFDYSGNNFNYIPFGSGRRMCAGLPLAEKMVPYVLASFLHSFEWKLPNSSGKLLDLSDKFGLVTKKLEPLVAIPTPRLSNLDIYSLKFM